MNRNAIDLLPESIRLRCQQGLRTGRYVAALILAAILIIATATHSRVQLERTSHRLEQARLTADLLLQTEKESRAIHAELAKLERQIALHDALAWPMRLTSLLATIINRLPESVSLDRLEVTAQTRAAGQSMLNVYTRSTRPASPDTPSRRILTGELAGFAGSDHDISHLIHALETTDPLQEISLDFSRTRTVRGRPAREFRVSFRIDLDGAYELGETELGVGSWESGIRNQSQEPTAKSQQPTHAQGATDA